jgi:hypothetical protein
MQAYIKTRTYEDSLKLTKGGVKKLVVFEIEGLIYTSNDHHEKTSKWAQYLEASDYLNPAYAVVSCRYTSYGRNNAQKNSTGHLDDCERAYKVPENRGLIKISGEFPILQSYVEYVAICEEYLDYNRKEKSMYLLNVLKMGFRRCLRMKDLKFMMDGENNGRELFDMVCLTYANVKRKHVTGRNQLKLSDFFHLPLLASKPALSTKIQQVIDSSGWSSVTKYPAIYKIFIHLATSLVKNMNESDLMKLNDGLLHKGLAWEMLSFDCMSKNFPFLEECIKYTLWVNEIKARLLCENPSFFKNKYTKETNLIKSWSVDEFLLESSFRDPLSYEYAKNLLEMMKRTDLDDVIRIMAMDKNTSLRLADMKRKLTLNTCVLSTINDVNKQKNIEAIEFYNQVILTKMGQSGDTIFKYKDLKGHEEDWKVLGHLEILKSLGYIVTNEDALAYGCFKNPLINDFMKSLNGKNSDGHDGDLKKKMYYTIPEYAKTSRRFFENIKTCNHPMESLSVSRALSLEKFTYKRLDLMFTQEFQKRLLDKKCTLDSLNGKPMDYWNGEVTLDGDQFDCLNAIVRTPLTAVVACPGRGKTVVIEAIYKLFNGNGEKKDYVCVATHGGCMASGLRERGILKAKTISKVLEDSVKCKYLGNIETMISSTGAEKPSTVVDVIQNRPLNYNDVEILVIDEASNVSQKLMVEITSKITFPNLKRIVLVLDITQTLPIEAGSPAIDLVKNSKKWNSNATIKDPRTSSVVDGLDGLVTTCILTKAHRFHKNVSTNCLNDDCILSSKLNYVTFGEVPVEMVSKIIRGDPVVPKINNHYFNELNHTGEIFVNSFSITNNQLGKSLVPEGPTSEEMRTIQVMANMDGFYKTPFGVDINTVVKTQIDVNQKHVKHSNVLNYIACLNKIASPEVNESIQILSLSNQVKDCINEIYDRQFGPKSTQKKPMHYESRFGYNRSNERIGNGFCGNYLGRKVIFKKNVPKKEFKVCNFTLVDEGVGKFKSKTSTQKKRVHYQNNHASIVSKYLHRFGLDDLHDKECYNQTALYNGKPSVFIGIATLYVGPLNDADVEGYLISRVKKGIHLDDSNCLLKTLNRLINMKRWVSSEAVSEEFKLENATRNPLKVMNPVDLKEEEHKSRHSMHYKKFAFFNDGSRICLDEASRELIQPGWCLTTNASQGREYESTMLVIEKKNVNSIFGLRHIHVALSRAKSTFLLVGGVDRFLSLAAKDSDITESRRTYLDLLFKSRIL